MTKWQAFKQKWSRCRRCPLAEHRANVVLARGKIPCKVLLIGEAPGLSEDILGKPFTGPAGKLLDQIIADAYDLADESESFCITNIVCCVPVDPNTGTKAVEPNEESIRSCWPRLKQFLLICRPRVVVCVGALAQKWVGYFFKRERIKVPLYEVVHPAAILRMHVVQRGLAIQSAIADLYAAIKDAHKPRRFQ